MAAHSQKIGNKVLMKGMNTAVRRALDELRVMEHIGEEKFEMIHNDGIDYIG